MKLAVTLMVRDEADIIQQWLDYHVAQGVDLLVVTDNGSVDGTREVLEAFAASGRIEVDLRHDPVHRKQQSAVVTQMARDAKTIHGADWVVNADADEFLIPKDRTMSLRDVFTALDPAVNAFVVPVVNMTGRLADTGAGLGRLVWRDERTPEELRAIGLIAHPSGNAIHVGNADVSVVQGNHLVTIPAGEAPPEELSLEVLHYPWRAWKQYEHRVDASGRAYEASPEHRPSPNHHGMRDFRRLRAGILKAYFAVRLVTDQEASTGDFTRDSSLVDFFTEHGIDLDGSTKERLVSVADAKQLSALGRALVHRDNELEELTGRLASETENVRLLESTVQRMQERITALEILANDRERQLVAMHGRRVVRWADRAGDIARRARTRIRG